MAHPCAFGASLTEVQANNVIVLQVPKSNEGLMMTERTQARRRSKRPDI